MKRSEVRRRSVQGEEWNPSPSWALAFAPVSFCLLNEQVQPSTHRGLPVVETLACRVQGVPRSFPSTAANAFEMHSQYSTAGDAK